MAPRATVPPFRNPSGTDFSSKGLLRWMVARAVRRLPRPPATPVVGVTPELEWIHANRDVPAATWIGHATVLLQVGGATILTDPVFSTVAGPVPFAGPRRHQPPGIALGDLPRVDVVLVSHAHYDHLDLRSVRRLMRQPGGPPTFLVPTGLDRWFARHVPGATLGGAAPTVRALAWGDGVERLPGLPGLGFHFRPVQHWASRTLIDRNRTQWGSWAILHPSFRFWFSGDLGYSDDPARIGAEFGSFDAAAIAIGAYEPRWFMRVQHVNPDEAVQVLLDVGAAEAFGIHWGTFPLTDEPLDQPPRDLAAAVSARGLAPERFTVLRHGETRRFSG